MKNSFATAVFACTIVSIDCGIPAYSTEPQVREHHRPITQNERTSPKTDSPARIEPEEPQEAVELQGRGLKSIEDENRNLRQLLMAQERQIQFLESRIRSLESSVRSLELSVRMLELRK